MEKYRSVCSDNHSQFNWKRVFSRHKWNKEHLQHCGVVTAVYSSALFRSLLQLLCLHALAHISINVACFEMCTMGRHVTAGVGGRGALRYHSAAMERQHTGKKSLIVLTREIFTGLPSYSENHRVLLMFKNVPTSEGDLSICSLLPATTEHNVPTEGTALNEFLFRRLKIVAGVWGSKPPLECTIAEGASRPASCYWRSSLLIITVLNENEQTDMGSCFHAAAENVRTSKFDGKLWVWVTSTRRFLCCSLQQLQMS